MTESWKGCLPHEVYDYDRTSRLASDPWSFQPVKGPPGTGYVTTNGRAVLGPRKDSRGRGKQWSLFLDGKEHQIQSQKPGFGHAEFILERELGPHYRDRRASR